MKNKMVIFGWAWFEMFRGEVVNDGISFGSRKPEFTSKVEGCTFLYVELFANKQALDEIDWRVE